MMEGMGLSDGSKGGDGGILGAANALGLGDQFKELKEKAHEALSDPSKLKDLAGNISLDGIKAQLMEKAISTFKAKCTDIGVPEMMVDILVSVVNNDK